MYELKPLSPESIPEALQKAERYRLLNDPAEAESICRDILAVDHDNREATTSLILSLTDQFGAHLNDTFQQACDLAAQLDDEYGRAYYSGLICERRAKQHLERGGPGSGYVAYDWYHKALEHYARAQELRPEGNDSSILRWNAVVRTLRRRPDVVPEPHDEVHHLLDVAPPA
jgi:tetratricopeptide (TPR) repeat protein